MPSSKKVTWKDENVDGENENGLGNIELHGTIENGQIKEEVESKADDNKTMNDKKEIPRRSILRKLGKSIDDGEIDDRKTTRSNQVHDKSGRVSKIKKEHELPKRSNSEPDFQLNKSQGPKKKSSEKYHVCIMCSPEKKFFIKNLQSQLEQAGYSCKVCSSADEYVPIAESETVICCVSLRYSKSTLAAREITKAEKLQKPIIPLLLDNIDFPPPGPLNSTMSRLIPVDCASVTFNSKWEGEEQTEEILDRLEVYIPDIIPKRKSSRRRNTLLSHIPRAHNSLRREKTLPIEPLAREASEIRIQIRPPTPVRKDVSYIPLPQRLQPQNSNANKTGDDEEDGEVEDEDGDSLEDEEDEESEDDSGSVVSTDSEVREARKLQKVNKLPQLPDAKRHRDQMNNNKTVVNGDTHMNGHAKQQDLPKANATNNQKQQPSRSTAFKYDSKLPLVYRQKTNNNANSRRY